MFRYERWPTIKGKHKLTSRMTGRDPHVRERIITTTTIKEVAVIHTMLSVYVININHNDKLTPCPSPEGVNLEQTFRGNIDLEKIKREKN